MTLIKLTANPGTATVGTHDIIRSVTYTVPPSTDQLPGYQALRVV